MKPPPPTTGLSATFIATPRPRAAGMLLTLAAILLLPHSTLALGINPDPGSGEVSSFAITRTVPGGTIHDPLVPLPGSEAYELSPDRTGKVSLTLSITHTFQGTITTTVRGSDGASITSVPGDNPTLTFYPLKDRYPFVITVLSPTGVPFFTRLIVPQELSSALGPGFTGNSYNHDFNIEQEYEYRIPQEDDSGDYGIGGKDVASGACGSCQSSCDLTHGSETANADTASGNGRFLAGFSAGISMQGDSSTGVDVDIDPAVGVSRSSFKSHGTGDATINRNGGNLNTITTGSAHTKFEDLVENNVVIGVKVLISKTPSDSEFRTITFVNTDTNEITRTSTFGGKSVETVWSYDDTGDDPTWTITMGNGARKAVLIREDDGSDPSLRVNRRKLYERADGASGVAAILVSEVVETHTKTLLGWRKTKSEVLGDSGGPLTTLWEYFGPSDGTVKAGLLKSVTRPDGGVETHEYSTTTYQHFHTITRPFADDTHPLVETREKTTSGSELRIDITVDNKYLSQRHDTWTSTGMVRVHNDGTDDLETSHTITPFGTDFGGIPSSVTMPDGTRITQSPNRNGGMRNLTVERGSPGTTGVGEGTRIHTIRNKDGIIEAKTVTAKGGDADGAVLDQFTVTLPTSDTVGRPTEIKYFGGAPTGWTINRSYACCGLASETDKFGIPTFYQHDDHGRRIRVNRLGVTKATVYDGLTVSTHRYPEDASDGIWSGIPSDTNKISSTTRNLANTVRTNESPDPSALDNEGIGIPGELTATTTTITHSSTGTASETDIPGVGSQTTYTHPDGRFWKTTGTLAPQRINAYAVNSTGLVTATAYLIEDGATPVIAEATATQSDRAGRTVATGIIPDLLHDTLMEVNVPAPGGTFTNATRQLYNGLGQLEITTDADGVTTLFTYNDKGERLLTVVDLNNNYDPEESTESAIDYGTDQITRTTTFPTVRSGNPGIPVIRTQTHVWQDATTQHPNGIETLVSQTDRTPDGLKSWTWQIGYGETSTISTAGLARTVTTTRPDSTYTRDTYSGGRLYTTISYDSGNTQITSLTYGNDTLNRPTTSLDSRTGITTTTAYLSATADFVQSVSEASTPARVNAYAYDSRGRQITHTLPDTTSVTHTSYTPRGEVEARWGSQTYPEFRTYDYAGRVKTLRTKPNFTQDVPVNTGGSLTTWNYYTDTGLLEEKLDDSSKGPEYTYTAAGRLQTRQWARGRLTVYAYTHGRLTGVAYHGTDALWQDYLAKRDLWLALLDDENATQQEIDDAEDEMNAARAINDAAPDTTTPNLVYAHDALGRVKSVTRGGVSHAGYTYRTSDLQLQTETQQIGTLNKTITRTYQTATNVTNSTVAERSNGYTFPGGSTIWTYNNAGRHHTLSDGTETFTYGYINERVESVSSPNLSSWTSWDLVHNMSTYRSTWAGQSEWQFDVYAEPNVLGQRDFSDTWVFHWNFETSEWDLDYFDSLDHSYDSFGQIDGSISSETSAGDRAYTYDSIGNRLTATADGDITSYWANSGGTLAGANLLNQYVKTTYPSGTIPSVHDFDGNLKTGPLPGAAALNPGMPTPSLGTLTWDGENRLVKAVVNNITVNYAYDHLSRLISRSEGVTPTTSTHYLYDGWNRIAEYTYASSQYTLAHTYLWGLDLSETPQGAGGGGGLLCIDSGSNTRYYPAYDLNGNVIAYLDNSGQLAAYYQYDPFGNLTVDWESNAADFPYRFSTKPQDPVTGLYYYGYRYYDPLTGRWPSRDPIEEQGGVNLYGFVGNDGVNRWDYIGLTNLLGEGYEFYNGNFFQSMITHEGDQGRAFKTEWGFYLKVHDEVMEVDVNIPIKFTKNASLHESAKNKAKSGVKSVWNRKFKLSCKTKDKGVCDYVIRVKLDFDVGQNTHNVILYSKRDYLRTKVQLNSKKWLGENINNILTVENVAAHETGHLLGNPDLYNPNGPGITVGYRPAGTNHTRLGSSDLDFSVESGQNPTNIMQDYSQISVNKGQFQKIRESAEKFLEIGSGDCEVKALGN